MLVCERVAIHRARLPPRQRHMRQQIYIESSGQGSGNNYGERVTISLVLFRVVVHVGDGLSALVAHPGVYFGVFGFYSPLGVDVHECVQQVHHLRPPAIQGRVFGVSVIATCWIEMRDERMRVMVSVRVRVCVRVTGKSCRRCRLCRAL